MPPVTSLSPQTADILVCIQHRADSSLGEISRLTGYREHVVRRVVNSLLDSGVLYKRAYISLYRLGYSKRAIFFSLNKTTETVKSKLNHYLQTDPNIAYVAEVGGDYRYKIDVCSRSPYDLYNFLTRFSSLFGQYLREKSVVQLLSQTEYSVKYPALKRFDIAPLGMGIGVESERIDDIDHLILHELSEIGEQPFNTIARRLSMPLTTLTYRIKTLREKRILIGFRYVVNLKALGGHDFFHLVYARGMNPAVKQRLHTFCRKHRFVRYFVECVGNWDFEIGSNVEDPSEATQLTEELHDIGGDDIVKISTLPLFGYRRVSNYPLNAAREEFLRSGKAHDHVRPD